MKGILVAFGSISVFMCVVAIPLVLASGNVPVPLQEAITYIHAVNAWAFGNVWHVFEVFFTTLLMLGLVSEFYFNRK